MIVADEWHTIYTFDVSTGRKGHATPTGTFHPIRMHEMWHSSKYENAPMPWSIFFNGGYATTNEKLRINSSGYVGVSNSSPTSTLHVTGSVAMSTVTKTANYTATASDYTIICNNSSGAITINLPTASGCSGRVYAIKKVSGVALNVTIDPFGSENIDGASTRILSVQYEGVLVQSDGSNWYVISKI